MRFAAIGLALLASGIGPLCSSVRAEGNVLAPAGGSWFTQNGPIYISFRKDADVRVNGADAPGIEANPSNDVTLSNSIGYNFTSNLSSQLVLGITPRTTVHNESGVTLGSVTYGAPSILFDYRLTQFGAFQPFVGVGAMYLFFTKEKDAALSNLKVDDALGLILRAGTEVMINSRFGVYFAANKIFIDADATANLGAATVDADLHLDPWIFQSGITYRF
ncbi:MAG: OmpW family protein [Hyphomicrobiaceae bacterium]